MQPSNFTAGIDFRLLRPADPRDRDGRFVLERGGGTPATLLELLGAPFDAVNTEIAPSGVHSALRPLLDMPRMSTMAIGAVLNLAVAAMPRDHAFVNVGTWHGYTLLAAMAGNPDAICVGIDDFSEHGGPRDEFGERFARVRSPRHTFWDMDYRDYLKEIHEGLIGVYLYDGEDSYEAELEALAAAEPFFADGCLLMADDANRTHRRQAMLDFADQSADDYSLVLDAHTAANRHPTFWNGTLVLRKSPAGPAEPPHAVGYEAGAAAAGPSPAPDSSVTVVLHAGPGDHELRGAVAAIEAQTWSNVELIVADSSPPAAALRHALERSSGDLVAFADAAADLRPDAVELSLAYPLAARFPNGPPDAALVERLRGGLAAGADVDSLLSPGTPLLLASDHHGLPETIAAGPATPLAPPGRPLRQVADEDAVNEVRSAAKRGIRHLVVLWTRFEWLDQRAGLRAHLAQHAVTLLANERVRVFALGGARP